MTITASDATVVARTPVNAFSESVHVDDLGQVVGPMGVGRGLGRPFLAARPLASGDASRHRRE